MKNLTSDFYINNRLKLGGLIPNSLIVLPAHKLLQYSMDCAYPFRQESNFLYLTGITEPDLVLLIDSDSGKSTLLLPNLNEYQETWDGSLDKNKIRQKSGIDGFETIDKLDELVKKAVSKNKKIGIIPASLSRVEPFGFYTNPARELLQSDLGKYQKHFVDIRKDIASLRQIKYKPEIENIKSAIKITSLSLNSIKKNINNFITEKEIEKYLTIEFLKNGADKHGFEPIVAGGKNASIIHYKHNNAALEKDSLVLLDVGAQTGHYSADISRTYEYGNVSNRKKEIFNELYNLQQILIGAVRPGVAIKQLQENTDIGLKQLCQKLKLEYKKLPHGVSHHLGIDLHDAANYQDVLRENMVITIEPGIYLPDESMGVRVEDDILVTSRGADNLSKSAQYY